MPQFDRFDICEAYSILEHDYGMGGWLVERGYTRSGNVKQVSVQLKRIGFYPSPLIDSREKLTENGREIYNAWVRKNIGEPTDSAQTCECCGCPWIDCAGCPTCKWSIEGVPFPLIGD